MHASRQSSRLSEDGRAVWRTSFSCIESEKYISSGVKKFKYWNIFLFYLDSRAVSFRQLSSSSNTQHHDVKSLTSKILVLWNSWSIDLLLSLHYRITSDLLEWASDNETSFIENNYVQDIDLDRIHRKVNYSSIDDLDCQSVWLSVPMFFSGLICGHTRSVMLSSGSLLNAVMHFVVSSFLDCTTKSLVSRTAPGWFARVVSTCKDWSVTVFCIFSRCMLFSTKHSRTEVLSPTTFVRMTWCIRYNRETSIASDFLSLRSFL